MLFAANSSSLIQRVLLSDSNGDPITGVGFDDADLSLSYNLQTVGSWVTPTLVDGTLGAYLENSWKEIGAGVYQWCPPNAVVVANTNTLVRAVYAANDPQYDTIEARLPVVDSAGAVELDSAAQSLIQKAIDGTGYLLAINAGEVSDPQQAASTYIITVLGATYTAALAGQTAEGVRTAPTLSKV